MCCDPGMREKHTSRDSLSALARKPVEMFVRQEESRVFSLNLSGFQAVFRRVCVGLERWLRL